MSKSNAAMNLSCLCVAALSVFAIAAHGENWPGFRGPTRQGISTEKNLPVQWSAESNVVWKAAVPGAGWSSPVIWNGRVYLTTVTENNTQCRVLCFDAKNGSVIWNTHVFDQVPRRKESKNSYATPTPVTDGKSLYTVFGDGSIAALDLGGKVLWTNRTVTFYSRHGLGASPLLVDGLLVMPFDGSNPNFASKDGKVNDDERLGWQIPWDKSFLLALDAKTGKEKWRGNRGMSRIAHVSPLAVREGGKTQIISGAGDRLQGFDPKNGELIWSIYAQGEGVTPSPVIDDGVIYASSGFEKTTLRAVKLGGKGDVTSSHILWEQKKGAPTQPSPVFVKPYLYTITDGGIVNCYNPKTGEIVYAERVGGNHCASPVYADGRIYFLNEAGEATVIATGPKFEILAKNPLGEKAQASISPSNGHLFIRTEKTLWCIGK